MQLHDVDSSMMNAVGYDESSKTLMIVFNSGKTYEYADVPAEVFAALLAADSKGQFFHDELDGLYSYRLRKGRGHR